MLFVGNQRGGGRDLALHLLKQENERVEIHEIRGFVGQDLASAFKESYAISKATKCKKHLYSLSINPPPDKQANTEDFENAIARVEQKLGLTGQPRAIVFHEKEGRRHAHAVWCRIDASSMKAVQLSHDHPKLMDVSRDLFIEHGWKMPRGMMNKRDRDPLNFSLAEWQQAKRAGKNAREVKSNIKDCWAVSDSKASFAHALKEHGYILAQGRRGHVAVDYQGEKYPVSRAVDLKAPQVRAKLGPIDELPSIAYAHRQAAQLVTDRLQAIQVERARQDAEQQRRLSKERERQRQAQAVEKQRLAKEQADRRQQERLQRQARLRNGLFGLWDRLTGKRKRTIEQNEQEAAKTQQRDVQEREAIATRQRTAQEILRRQVVAANQKAQSVQTELQSDIKQLHAQATANTDNDREAFKAKRRATSERTKRRRSRSRDGPMPGR